MKVYKITLSDRSGAPFIVTVTANSFYEAMKKVSFESGWKLQECCVIGGAL